MKKATNELSLNITTGANFTSENYDDNVDGEKINLGANYGLPIGENGGFINLTGNFDFRGGTNRMKEWEGQIFNQYNNWNDIESNISKLRQLRSEIDHVLPDSRIELLQYPS